MRKNDKVVAVTIGLMITGYVAFFWLSACSSMVEILKHIPAEKHTKVEHYNKDGHYTGYSYVYEEGKTEHFDKLGHYTGYSREEDKAE